MGGTKRSIAVEKITDKDPRAVAFSKRRYGLYSKSSDLCVLSGAQMAILATPVSDNSHVSFYSFGHSSVDSVVRAFLNNERPPPENLGLGRRWWEDESLTTLEDPNELKSVAMDSISSMTKDLKALRLEKQKDHEELVSHGSQCHQEETLTLKSSNEEFGDLDDILTNSQGLFENLEMNNNVSVASTSQNPWSGSEAVEDIGALVFHKDLDEVKKCFDEVVNKCFADLDEDQTVAMCDYNKNDVYNDVLCGNFDGCNKELVDLDLIFDYDMYSEAMVGEVDKFFSDFDEYLSDSGNV